MPRLAAVSRLPAPARSRPLAGPVGLLAALAAWQWAALGARPDFLLGPAEVARHFAAAVASGELVPHVTASLGRALPGFALGAALGIAVGLWAGVARGVEQAVGPMVFLTYPVPKIVMLPLFMLWFG